MPGIHVRSLGKLDWVERGNEPILTIPGAYWLCHKKHIYKFTFKWHKTLRNTEDFAYPKELTKVIRRIIKSQPRQGQQFGTRHLLVTYNHSAWMRQDKMFAMLKFRDRTDATAFPHAFVLTVKTLNVLTPDESCSSNKSGECSNTIPETVKNSRLQNIENDDEKHDKTDSNLKNHEGEKNNKNFAELTSESSINDSRDSENDRKKDPGKKLKRRKSFDDIESLPSQKRQNRRENLISNEIKDKNSLNTDGIVADTADLPYQYIIEKEIENSKILSEDDCLTADEAESNPGTSQNSIGLQGKILARSPRAAQTDTTRSADITDLVMEGLMFTIRQDQDSITVVEQKTKLEMDEVLENSEKAETKEGEKCLLNSSLLRLENLITKIDMPGMRCKNNIDDNLKSSTIGNDKNIDNSFFYNSSRNTKNFDISSYKYDNSIISDMPKFPLVKINLSNINDVFNDEFSDKSKEMENNEINKNIDENRKNDEISQEIEEEEEEEEEEDEVGLELKYEEKDDSENDKMEKDFDEIKDEEIVDNRNMKNNTKNRSYDLSTTPIKDCIGILKSNTPRIVSNEIITDDQIPPELQRALRYKRTKKLFYDDENDKKFAKNSINEELSTEVVSEKNSSPSEGDEKNRSIERTNKISENSIDIELNEQELSIEKIKKQMVKKTTDRSNGIVNDRKNSTSENIKENVEKISSKIELPISSEKIGRNRPIVESAIKPFETSVDIELSEQENSMEKRRKQPLRKTTDRSDEIVNVSKNSSLNIDEKIEKISPKIESPISSEKIGKNRSIVESAIKLSATSVELSIEKRRKQSLRKTTDRSDEIVNVSKNSSSNIDEKTEKISSEFQSPISSEKIGKNRSIVESSIKSSETSVDIELSEHENSIEKRRKQPLRKTTDRSDEIVNVSKNLSSNIDEKNEKISPVIKLPISTEKIVKNRTIVESSIKSSVTSVDITEVFERELLNEKRRKKSLRRTSLRHTDESTNNSEKPEIRIEMWKFMQDITRGAKVVVRRLDLSNIPNITTKSSITKYNANQRYANES